ncbi:hypothetical protein EJ02DRAFT_451685 [Clathrospora elynae]|uniref:Uncharacterized protein n=1 Tax=Clathrospora elynae TaxID=706981 RepID=A0A6A5SZJ0_9PLEO|nr:hypothetical protein EJ02DRAFT_460596 [Clathrospora elynae]KAF1945400.1 hypothetical protein EJ02DRAFT_451685 [Clathrospora elynae]
MRNFPSLCSLFFLLSLLFPLSNFLSLLFLLLLSLLLESFSIPTSLFKLKLLADFVIFLLLLSPYFLEFFFSLFLLKE